MKITIDEAMALLKRRRWNVGDISFNGVWYVHCTREDESVTTDGKTQTEAWEKAVQRVMAIEN